MPLQYGHLNDHINRVFGGKNSTTFWQRLREWEEMADESLAGAGKDSRDPFRIYLRDLPRDIREEAIATRGEIFDFEGLFRQHGGAFSVYKDVVDSQGKPLGEAGFGSFALPREAFIGTQSAEELASKLAYVTQTVNIDPYAQGASRYSLSGSTLRAKTFLDAGEQLTKLDEILEGTRLVFDVETPGLDARKGIWQLSARMMKGDQVVLDAEGKERTVNLLFRNQQMDGLYYLDEANPAMLFEDFYQQLRGGGAIDWIDEENFAPQMRKFLEMARDSDYLVGQNTAFDVTMLEHALRGKENSSPAFKELVAGLREQIAGGKVVDTRLFSKAIFGDIAISPHLTNQDIFTKHSMENILLETSFLDDLATDLGDDGWSQIRARIKQGMHHGDVDTWFEDHLFRMQADVLSGKRTGILTARTLEDPALVKEIVRAQAITPVTKGKNLLTPMQNLIHHQRRWDSDLAEHSTSAKLRQGGIFSNWADSVLTQEGVMSRKARLATSGFDAVQAAAMEQNLPFAGLSSFERLISTQLGRHATNVGPNNINALRSLMGDVIGGTIFKQHTQMSIYGGGTNVALPLELIRAAERSQLLEDRGVNILGTRFADATEAGVDALETVRLSTIHWGDQKDIAMVADIFKEDADIERFIKFLRTLGPEELEKYGVSADMIDEYASALRRYGKDYGVQIGILEGKNNRDIGRVVSLLEESGYGVDSKQAPLRASVYGIEGFDDLVGTGPTIVDTENVFNARHADILEHTQEVSRLANEMVNPDLDPAIPRAVEMSRGSGEVNRIYSFVDEYIQKAKKIQPKHLGLAAAGLAGYYLWNRQEEREPYTEAFAQQDFEDDAFYERYKEEMGEPVPPNYRQSAQPLDTAGMVQRLDRNKIGHHSMGADKYSHLFGG